MNSMEQARFDARLPKEQKEFFEYAATLGGFRNLTDFIIYSVQQQASKIVESNKAILASKRDQEIFFDAIMNPSRPNDNLINAASQYKEAIANK